MFGGTPAPTCPLEGVRPRRSRTGGLGVGVVFGLAFGVTPSGVGAGRGPGAGRRGRRILGMVGTGIPGRMATRLRRRVQRGSNPGSPEARARAARSNTVPTAAEIRGRPGTAGRVQNVERTLRCTAPACHRAFPVPFPVVSRQRLHAVRQSPASAPLSPGRGVVPAAQRPARRARAVVGRDGAGSASAEPARVCSAGAGRPSRGEGRLRACGSAFPVESRVGDGKRAGRRCCGAGPARGERRRTRRPRAPSASAHERFEGPYTLAQASCAVVSPRCYRKSPPLTGPRWRRVPGGPTRSRGSALGTG